MAYYIDVFFISALLLSILLLPFLALRGPFARFVLIVIAILALASFLVAMLGGPLNWKEHDLLAGFLTLVSLFGFFLVLPLVLVVLLMMSVVVLLGGKSRPQSRPLPGPSEENQHKAVWREAEKMITNSDSTRKLNGENK